MEDKENFEEGEFMEEHMKEHMKESMKEWCGCGKEIKKEFKMALLRKKEKMLEAKLEFIREIRKIMEKMAPEAEKKTEEKV